MKTPFLVRSHIGHLAFPLLCFALAVSPPASGQETTIPAKQSWRISSSDETGPPEILEVGSNEFRTSVALLAFELPSDVELGPQAAVIFEMEIESSDIWGGVWVNLFDAAADPGKRLVDTMESGEIPAGVIVPAPRKENPRGPMAGKVSLRLPPEAVDQLRSERKLVLVLHGSPPEFIKTMYRIFSESSDSPPVLRIVRRRSAATPREGVPDEHADGRLTASLSRTGTGTRPAPSGTPEWVPKTGLDAVPAQPYDTHNK